MRSIETPELRTRPEEDHVVGLSRRRFTREALHSLTALALLDGLLRTNALGRTIQPLVDHWLAELNAISQDLKDQKKKDIAFQASLEALYRKVDLQTFLDTINFDRLAAGADFPAVGARSLPVDFQNVSGLPTSLVYGRQIFAMKKGRSVIPHGHDNMATGFLILKGDFRGRHWDRIEDHKDFYILKPTIDRAFAPGDCSTISDHKDNIHWFTAESDVGFIFNIHVTDYNHDNPKKSGRVYLDPLGEKLAGGLVKAPRITYGEANRRYG
jgi:hypothetical protein